MSQSTPEPAEGRVVLFQNGGELEEFRGLLSELEVPVEEASGALPGPSKLDGVRLAIVSGKRLLESGGPDLSVWPRTIAVIDDSSKTLVTHLARAGAAMVIRRPIHPRALRLLLLHEIYRGPERRRRNRILIGHPIRLSSGLFRPHAMLLELSPSGARIELANPPKVGAKIRILIGKDLTKSKPIKLQAKVVRSIRPSDGTRQSESEIGVAILDANRHAKVLKSILDRFALGPAPWQSKTNSPANEANETSAPSLPITLPKTDSSKRSLPPTRSPIAEPPVPKLPETTRQTDSDTDNPIEAESNAPTAPRERAPEKIQPVDETVATHEPAALPDTESDDRRQEKRIPYDRRIIALGEEAARVLVGRDLSLGGMRIAATPSISVGDKLRVALHSVVQTEPIVIIARALRDDGDDGLVLAFDDLSSRQTDQLEKIIADSLPVHASADEFDDPSATSESIVVAEMIETISEASADADETDRISDDASDSDCQNTDPSQHSVESEAEIDAHLDSVFDTD